MEKDVSEPVTLIPFQVFLPGQAAPGAPIKDFRPVVEPADAPEPKKEVPSIKAEDGGEGDDPKGDTVMVSADSSKKMDDSPKDASRSPEEKSVDVVTVVSASKPVVPSLPTSSSETKRG